MLSTISMEANQGYQFEEPRFLPWLPQLGVSQPTSEAHKNKIKLSWKIHASHTSQLMPGAGQQQVLNVFHSKKEG